MASNNYYKANIYHSNISDFTYSEKAIQLIPDTVNRKITLAYKREKIADVNEEVVNKAHENCIYKGYYKVNSGETPFYWDELCNQILMIVRKIQKETNYGN